MSGQELDRYWKTVVNTIRDGIMIVNTGGAIVSVNTALERITGYCRAEMIGKTCEILECDACRQLFENNGSAWCRLFQGGFIGQHQCRIRRKDGLRIHVLKNAAILKDDSGHPIGAVETIADLSEIIEKDNQLEAFRRELCVDEAFHGIIGTSAGMQQVFDLIENAARSDAPVIIFGESGTGKELVGRAIHEIGNRREHPFVKVNCASLTASLLESELFGHVRGAYTGAYRDRIGRFEKAAGGDLFLDEIGDLPVSMQVKLLRVIEEKIIERVGSSTPMATDVRIISATNRNLLQLVESGAFRKDFYFRINVIPIHLPPLRKRADDIPLLAESFFRKMRLKSGKTISGISNEAVDLLMNHVWPGNVRELKSAFEYAFVTCHENMIQPCHFPASVIRGKGPVPPTGRKSFNMKEIEKQELLEALEKTGGNQSKAADFLGVSRVTVWNRMKRHGINATWKIEVDAVDRREGGQPA